MKKIIRALILALSLLGCLGSIHAQAQLKPSIGIGTLPADSDPICDIPNYLGFFDVTGYFPGDTIPEFNLYDLDDNEVVMSELLAPEKPVLIVNGSYTCPVFRNKVPVINDLEQQFGDELDIIVVYTVEAHPIIDISPYFGFVNPGNANLTQEVLYQQPTTYGERKAIVADMLNEMDIQVPVYLDGPCNEWWLHYGPAPNNSYLISPNGTVISKHPWFDKHPQDIYCDLEELLGLPADCNPSGGGDFTFSMTSAPTVTGPSGTTIYVTGKLVNQTDNGVEIEIARLIDNTPAEWTTSICTDVCYPPDQTSALLWLEPGESLDYTNYFYTGAQPDSGKVKIGFRNTTDSTNFFTQWMGAGTYLNTSAGEAPTADDFRLFPNPARAGQRVHMADTLIPVNAQFILYDLSGREVLRSDLRDRSLQLPNHLDGGLYFYHIRLPDATIHTGHLVVE